MHLFYYPVINGKTLTLDKTESSHCIKVLRLGMNDPIFLTDGMGKLYRTEIINPDRKACMVRLLEETHFPPERRYKLYIAIAPTRNIERFEWFLEKATEIGVDRIIPLLCRNSERRVVKEDRLRKVMISAMKQSLKSWLPEITALTRFEDVLTRPFSGTRFIATGSEPFENNPGKLYRKDTDALFLIGPEGDFSDDELQQAREYNFKPVSLGKSRLRTETAGLVACHSVNFINSF